MTILTASETRQNLYRLIDKVAEEHVPVFITGKRANAVLVSESDWNSMQETIYLASIPGMTASITEGMAASSDACVKKLSW